MVFHWASFQSPAKHLLSKFQMYTTSSNRNQVGVKKTGIHGLKRRSGPWSKYDIFRTGPGQGRILRSRTGPEKLKISDQSGPTKFWKSRINSDWSSGGLWILGPKLRSFHILELLFQLRLTELFKKLKYLNIFRI